MRLILLLLFVPSFAFAEGLPHGWFEPRQSTGEPASWKHGTTVMIKGENLKGVYTIEHGYPPEKELCFASETIESELDCIKPDDSNIKSWTDNVITFTLTDTLPPIGLVKLRYKEWKDTCHINGKIFNGKLYFADQICWQIPITIGYYKLYPEITGVTEKSSGLQPSGVSVGKEYKISGYWFGTNGSVFLGKKMLGLTDIISWQPTSIIIKPTSFAGSSIIVQNAAKKSPEFFLSNKAKKKTDPNITEQPVQTPKKEIKQMPNTRNNKKRVIKVRSSSSRSSSSSLSSYMSVLSCKKSGQVNKCLCPSGYKVNRDANQCIRKTK